MIRRAHSLLFGAPKITSRAHRRLFSHTLTLHTHQAPISRKTLVEAYGCSAMATATVVSTDPPATVETAMTDNAVVRSKCPKSMERSIESTRKPEIE